MKKPAFIHVALCDNDYSMPLEEAVTRVYRDFGTDHSEEVFRNCVVKLATALCLIRSAGDESGTHNVWRYLNSSVVVTYSNEPPAVDHDGGSVAIDTNLNYIWRY
jgi:hypothetical protein